MSIIKKNLSIQNFYLKNMVFDAPNPLTSFSSDGKREMDYKIDIKKRQLSEKHNLHEVELHIHATGKMQAVPEEGGDSKVVLEMSFIQGGTFHIIGYEDEALDYILSTTCAGMVYPFAVDVISSTVYKIGFPLMVIPPVDFEEIYRENYKNNPL